MEDFFELERLNNGVLSGGVRSPEFARASSLNESETIYLMSDTSRLGLVSPARLVARRRATARVDHRVGD